MICRLASHSKARFPKATILSGGWNNGKGDQKAREGSVPEPIVRRSELETNGRTNGRILVAWPVPSFGHAKLVTRSRRATGEEQTMDQNLHVESGAIRRVGLGGGWRDGPAGETDRLTTEGGQ